MLNILALLAFAFVAYLLLLAITPNPDAGIHTDHHSTMKEDEYGH